MIELTAEDWHSIHCATKDVKDPFTTPEGISAIAEANYRAGLASGLERAANVCDKWAENALSKQDGKLYDVDTNLRMMAIGPQDCAAAIRALNAPAAP